MYANYQAGTFQTLGSQLSRSKGWCQHFARSVNLSRAYGKYNSGLPELKMYGTH